MRFRTYQEATAFVKGLMQSKLGGSREYLTAKLDSVPQWQKPTTPPPAMDGARVTGVYMAYRKPTDKQKERAAGAKLAGVDLREFNGRLVDVRTCNDKTVQLMCTTGMRASLAPGEIPWFSANVDKGILCALSIGEGLGESVEEILARVPQAMVDALRAGKGEVAVTNVPTPELIPAAVITNTTDTPTAPAQPSGTVKVK